MGIFIHVTLRRGYEEISNGRYPTDMWVNMKKTKKPQMDYIGLDRP